MLPSPLPKADANDNSQLEMDADKKRGLDIFSKDLKMDVHMSNFFLLTGMMADPNCPNAFSAQITARVNHGQRQGQTQADILNNMIGNPAGFNGLPCASMSNDNLFWRLLGLVSGYLTWKVNRKTYTLRTNRQSLTICPGRKREYNDKSENI